MKHNYSTFWLSACFILCLLLCGNVSAQPVTSFEVQRPDFMSEPYELHLMLRAPTSSDTEVGREFYAAYNSETGKYEIHDLRNRRIFSLMCITLTGSNMPIFCLIRLYSV